MNKRTWFHRIFKILVIILVGLIYMEVNSRGFMRVMPVLGTRISEIDLPGLWLLAGYKGCNPALAQIFALLLFFGTCWLLTNAFYCLLYERPYSEEVSEDNAPMMYYLLGIAVFIIDLLLFLLGSQDESWGSGIGLTFKNVIGTLAYGGILLVVSLVSAHLSYRET